MSVSSKPNIVGIDLGTTNSEIYKVVLGKPEPCVGPNKTLMTPSRVVIDPKSKEDTVKYAVGANAKNVAKRFPENEIYEVKRVIGRKYKDDYVKRDIHFWPFSIIEGEDGLPYYHVKGDNREYDLSAVDIDAQILRTMKNYVKEGVDNVVITVPSYFSKSQIEDTKKAGELAGFNVKKIIPEPVAAAIAYGQKVGGNLNNHVIMVYDLGGGTFDCCIVQQINNQFKVLAKDGHSHLGGADFDNAIVRYVCTHYKQKHNIDLYERKADLNALKSVAEKVKIALSDKDKYSYLLSFKPHPIRGVDEKELPEFSQLFERQTFEDLIRREVNMTIDYINRTLQQLDMTINNVTDIVCVGGSTRIPLVRQSISAYFNNRPINFEIVDIDGAVAEGAAIYADYLERGIDLLDGDIDSIPTDDPFPLPDPIWSIPYNIYYNYGDGYVQVFRKNQDLSKTTDKKIRVNRNIERPYDNMNYLYVYIYYSTDDTAEKQFLGKCKLEITERCLKTGPSFSICFTYNNQGKLSCVISDRKTSMSQSYEWFCRGDALDDAPEREAALLYYKYEKEVTQMLRDSLTKGNSEEVVNERNRIIDFLTYLEEFGDSEDAESLEAQYHDILGI